MRQSFRSFFTKGKKKTRAAVDWFSALLVCLFPVVTGVIFFRLLYMAGVPVWFMILQGLIFVASFVQAIYFFAVGLIRAVRRNPDDKKGGEQE